MIGREIDCAVQENGTECHQCANYAKTIGFAHRDLGSSARYASGSAGKHGGTPTPRALADLDKTKQELAIQRLHALAHLENDHA